MDRTTEFQSLLEPKYKSLAAIRTHDSESVESNNESASRTGFNTEAARIGQEIHIAQLKLDELGKSMCVP